MDERHNRGASPVRQTVAQILATARRAAARSREPVPLEEVITRAGDILNNQQVEATSSRAEGVKLELSGEAASIARMVSDSGAPNAKGTWEDRRGLLAECIVSPLATFLYGNGVALKSVNPSSKVKLAREIAWQLRHGNSFFPLYRGPVSEEGIVKVLSVTYGTVLFFKKTTFFKPVQASLDQQEKIKSAVPTAIEKVFKK